MTACVYAVNLRQIATEKQLLVHCPRLCFRCRQARRLCHTDSVCRQQRVHRPGTKALEIKRDKFESQRLENSAELAGHLSGHGMRHFFLRDLDARNVTMMTHPKLTKAEPPKRILTLLDHTQCFDCHRAAILDSR